MLTGIDFRSLFVVWLLVVQVEKVLAGAVVLLDLLLFNRSAHRRRRSFFLGQSGFGRSSALVGRL